MAANLMLAVCIRWFMSKLVELHVYILLYCILLYLIAFLFFLLVRTALQPQWSLAFILAEGQVSKLRVWTSLLGIPGIPSLAMHLMQRLRASHSMYFQVPVLLLAVHSVRICSVSKPHARCKQTSRETDVVVNFWKTRESLSKGLALQGKTMRDSLSQPLLPEWPQLWRNVCRTESPQVLHHHYLYLLRGYEHCSQVLSFI